MGASARDAAQRPRRVRVARLRLHRHGPGNPQASQLPAFCVPGISIPHTATRTTTHTASRARRPTAVDRRDDARARTAPRAIAGPMALHTERGRDREAVGFRFALTFDPEPALASRPLAIARFSLSTGSRLPPLVERLQAGDMLPRVRRFVRLARHRCGGRIPQKPSACSARPSTRPDPGRHRHRDRRGRAGTGRTSCGVVPDAAIPVRADVYLRFAWQFQTRAGVRRRRAARGGARYRRRRARGHLPRLWHLHLRDGSRRGGQRAGGARRRRVRRAVGGRRRAARHRRGAVAAAGATNTDLLQGRATRTAGSSARVGHHDYS